MNGSSKGIIINRKKVSGADVLLTILTREYGKKKFYVNGARHTKSKLSSGSQLFIEGEFSLYLKTGLSTVNELEIIDIHSNIREDLNKFFLASYVSEIVDKIIKDDEGDQHFYEFLSSALKYLNDETKDRLKLFRIVFLIKILKIIGYSPNLENCSLCSKKIKKQKKILFSPFSGGIVCEECRTEASDIYYLSSETLFFIKTSLEKSYTYIRNLNISVNILEESDNALTPFLEHHALVTKLKSQKMLFDMGL